MKLYVLITHLLKIRTLAFATFYLPDLKDLLDFCTMQKSNTSYSIYSNIYSDNMALPKYVHYNNV